MKAGKDAPMPASGRPLALVTGASGAIGHAISVALAASGHRVALHGRDRIRLQAVAAGLGQAAAGTLAADLATDAGQDQLLAALADLGPVQVLVNNAGTAPSARFEDTEDATLDRVLALHVRAPFRLLRSLLPGMRAAGSGAVVQLASTAGLRGFPFTAAYGMAKHAMVGLARALRAELAGTGIHSYAVCPGFVESDITRSAAAAIAARGRSSPEQAFRKLAQMNRIGRMHRADEVAAAVARLVVERPDGCVLDLDRAAPTIEE